MVGCHLFLLFFYPGGSHFLGSFTGFLFFFFLGGILAAAETFVPPLFIVEALAVLVRVTLWLAEHIYGAIINKFGFCNPWPILLEIFALLCHIVLILL
jgi:hypothetical protein